MKRCRLISNGRTVASGMEFNSSSELAEHVAGPAITISLAQAEAIRKLKEALEDALHFSWRIESLVALTGFVIENTRDKESDPNGFIIGGLQEVLEMVAGMIRSQQEIMDLTLQTAPDLSKSYSASPPIPASLPGIQFYES